MSALKLPRARACRHRFAISGLNLERFINLMRAEGVALLSVKRRNARTLVCECYSADVERVAAAVQEKGWRMSDVHPAGISGWLSLLRRRPGIPVGMVLFCVVVIVLSQLLWQVDIRGAGAYEAEISSYLRESGYAPGRLRRTVDAQALEDALTYRYPQLTWFHVYVRGTALMVEVTPGAAMPPLPDGSAGNIVAARMGIVDSVRVFAGTAMVKAGDVVQKGQLLIRGEERGADGSTVSVAADGVVMARCWHTETVVLPLCDIQSRETGREVQSIRVRTPFACFPEKWESPPFLAYNTYLRETPLVGLFLPVMRQCITHREVEMEYLRRSEEEVRREAADAAVKRLKSALKTYDIIDKWVDYCMIEDESLSANATAEWLMDIGEKTAP